MGATVLGIWACVDFFVHNYCHYVYNRFGKSVEKRVAYEYVMAVCFKLSV